MSDLDAELAAAAAVRDAAHDRVRAGFATAYNASIADHCAADDAYAVDVARIRARHAAGVKAVTVDA